MLGSQELPTQLMATVLIIPDISILLQSIFGLFGHLHSVLGMANATVAAALSFCVSSCTPKIQHYWLRTPTRR